MFNRVCFLDDREIPFPHYDLYKRCNVVVQTGIAATLFSWLIVPSLRFGACHSPALFGLLPALALSYVGEAYVEVKQYQALTELKHRQVTSALSLRMGFAVAAAVVATVAVAGWLLATLTGVSLFVAPYLTVAALALRSLYNGLSLRVAYQRYQASGHPLDRLAYRESLVAETVKLGLSLLVLVTAVGLLLVPFPALVFMPLLAITAAANAGCLLWNSSPASWRQSIKERYSMFKKRDLEDTPCVRPGNFGLEPGP